MNIATNRKAERIEYLFSLLGVFNNKNEDMSLYSNNIKEITTTLSSDFISGVIVGDGSFLFGSKKMDKSKLAPLGILLMIWTLRL
jgi:F0F1-type ATP synthase assembly protein I